MRCMGVLGHDVDHAGCVVEVEIREMSNNQSASRRIRCSAATPGKAAVPGISIPVCRRGNGLARTSHQPSAAMTGLALPPSLRSVDRPQRIAENTSSAGLGRRPCRQYHLSRFATKASEKSGLSLFCLLWVLVATAGGQGSPDDVREALPEAYRADIQESLRLAGDNAEELEKVIEEVDEDLREEASFILANIPYRDLGTVTGDLLLENIQWAHTARESLPWGPSIPDDIYRHYVLPYRVTQERLVSWRPFFFDELFPRIRECTTMYEAAVEVNRWLDEKIDFKTSERRDQDPVTTVRRGIGRCEEMTIAFVVAARSVCIPARSCWTPWWSLNDNNHAWAEIWADGQWYFTGSAEAREKLNEAWFKKPAKHAAAVYSTCFGVSTGEEERIYRQGDRYTLINSTHVYTDPCELRVKVTDTAGAPASCCRIWANVFNYGWFRAVASKETDDEGWATLVLGPGEYLLTGGTDTTGSWRKVRLSAQEPDSITLTLGNPSAPEGFTWLRYFP